MMNIKQIWYIDDEIALQVCPKCYVTLTSILPIENTNIDDLAKSISLGKKIPAILEAAYERYKASFKYNTHLDIELDYVENTGHLWKITNAVGKTREAVIFEKQYGAMQYKVDIGDN